MKTRIGVIFGGRSGEHEISIRSAKTVIEQADKLKYSIVPMAISREGEWLDRQSSIALLPDSTLSSIETSEDLSKGRFADVDIVFPVLHGTNGEDGTIQGLFEIERIPYIGCGVLASSCGMDKVVMKSLFQEAGLPICKYAWFLRSEWERAEKSVIDLIETNIGYPCFVKPANLGSSVGVSRANDADSLKVAVEEAAKYDRKIVVEENIEMREIECAVIGNEDPEASLPGEYIIRDADKRFLDYTEKYAATGNNEFTVPAPISDELADKIKKLAILAFKAIDGSGLARVDFFLRTDTGTLMVNEINTMPGLTDASGFPKMWAASGMPFSAVIDKLVELGLDRFRDTSRNKTDFN